MNKYSFRFLSNKVNPYLFAGILSPFVTIWLVIFLDVVNVPLMMCAILAPIVFAAIMMFKKGRARDEITLDDRGFTSTYYGRVNFADIEGVVNLPWYQRNPPTMVLKLKSGKRLRWNLTWKGSFFNSTKDAEVFDAFTSALIERLHQFSPPKNPFTGNAQHQDLSTLAGQLQEEKKRNNNPVWAIPLGVVVALTALVRTCGKDWLPNRSPDFGKIAAVQEQLYEENMATAMRVMDSMMKVNGPAFMYTNDTGATLRQAPDLDIEETPGIRVFQQTAANMALKRFIAHPDSFPPQLYVIGSDSVYRKLRKSILNMNDSATRFLFIRVYDTFQHIKPLRYPGREYDSTKDKVYDLTTAIPVYDTTKLGEAIDQAFPAMHFMLAQVRHRSSFKVYLAGRQSDGVPEALFQRAVRELNKQLHAVKADTSRFVTKTFFK